MNTDEKKRLRKEVLAWRRTLTDTHVAGLSRRIQERLCQSSYWRDARRIALYSALPREVRTDHLLAQGVLCKKEIYLPRLMSATEMCFCRYTSEKLLERNSFGQAQ